VPEPLNPRPGNNFDALRFVFACAVIYAHSYYLLGNPGEAVTVFSRGQAHSGRIAVHAFFIISGYLITISFERSRSTFAFLQNRILRIFPGFIAMGFVCILLVAPVIVSDVHAYFAGQNWPRLLYSIATLQKLDLANFSVPASHDPTQINGSLWTIRIEFECYLVTLFLGVALLLKRRLLILGLFFAVWLLQSWVALNLPFPAWFTNVVPARALTAHPQFLSYYLAGTVVALFFRDLRPHWVPACLALAAWIVGARAGGLQVVEPFALTYLVFALAFTKSVRLHGFARHGDFSYGIYLYGWPMQQLVLHLFHGELSPTTLTLLATLAALACAALSWRFVEKPALLLKRPKSERPAVVKARPAA